MSGTRLLLFAISLGFINVCYSQQGETQYADILVDAEFKKYNDFHKDFYGGSVRGDVYDQIDPKAVLGNNNYYVSLPKGSFLVMQFTDNLVFDQPNQDDLFIAEQGAAGDMADVYVSADGKDYKYLGRASGGITNSMDLADISFNETVSHIAIVGLDVNGASPGFDVIKVYGLPNSTIEKYVSHDSIDTYLATPNKLRRRVLLKPIQFEFDQYLLDYDEKIYLDRLSMDIRQFPDVKLKIVGHTDNLGSTAYNDLLSKRRAKSVYEYLIANGVSQFNLQYEGRGAREPLMSNDTEEGMMTNRRVELVKVD